MTRHSARADRDERNWRPLPGHSVDDTECSSGGNQATRELAALFETIEICHIVSSPFYRCVQTIGPIAAEKKIKIKIEPGICEILTTYPPGFKDSLELAEEFDIDTNYKAVVSRDSLRQEYSDRHAANRSRQVAITLREKLEGPILFCGHGASCLGIGEAFNSSGYVGYSSFSHFSHDGKKWSAHTVGDVSHLTNKKLREQSLSSAW